MEARHPSYQTADSPDSRPVSGRSQAPQPQAAIRHLRRERDFGIGYGNSSGYASDRRFSDGHVDPLFQFR